MKIIFAIAALAISSTALAMGVPPSAADQETAANKVVPAERLVEVRIDAQTVTNARQKGVSTDAEIKATAGFQKAANNGVYAAVDARRALNLAEFNKQAAIVKEARDKACAILSGC